MIQICGLKTPQISATGIVYCSKTKQPARKLCFIFMDFAASLKDVHTEHKCEQTSFLFESGCTVRSTLCVESTETLQIFAPSPNELIETRDSSISINYPRFRLKVWFSITISINTQGFESPHSDCGVRGLVWGGVVVCYEAPLFAPWNDLLSVELLPPPSLGLNIIIHLIVRRTRAANHFSSWIWMVHTRERS